MHVDSLHIDCAYRFIFDKALVNKQDLSTYIFRALSGIFYIWAGRSIMMNYIVLLYIIYVNYIVMSRVQKERHTGTMTALCQNMLVEECALCIILKSTAAKET